MFGPFFFFSVAFYMFIYDLMIHIYSVWKATVELIIAIILCICIFENGTKFHYQLCVDHFPLISITLNHFFLSLKCLEYYLMGEWEPIGNFDLDLLNKLDITISMRIVPIYTTLV